MKARTLSHCVDKDRKEIPILQIFSELSRRSFGRGCVPQSGFRTAARKIPGSGKHARTTLWSHTAARRKTPAETAAGSRPESAAAGGWAPPAAGRTAPPVPGRSFRPEAHRPEAETPDRPDTPASPSEPGPGSRKRIRTRYPDDDRPECATERPHAEAGDRMRISRDEGLSAPASFRMAQMPPRHEAAVRRQPETMPEETQGSGLLRTCAPNCTRLPKFIFLFVNLYVTLPDKAP